MMYEQYTDMTANAQQAEIQLEAEDDDMLRILLPITEFNQTMLVDEDE